MDTMIDPLAAYPVELINRAGRSMWRGFREWVELDDCTQEAWVAYFTYRKEFDAKIASGEEHYVAKSIRHFVGEYARRQKAIMCGYQTSDEEYYGRRRVRALLEYYLSGEQTPPVPAQQLGVKIRATGASDGTDVHVELLDMGRAWTALDQHDRDCLWTAYGPGEPTDGVQGDQARQQARRALGRLLDLLNGDP